MPFEESPPFGDTITPLAMFLLNQTLISLRINGKGIFLWLGPWGGLHFVFDLKLWTKQGMIDNYLLLELKALKDYIG